MTTLPKAPSIEDASRAKLRATPEGVARFRAAKFGLSMHWGLYALEGRGEWVYFQERIPLEVYRRRLGRFDPARFDAEEWADLLLEAGCRFLLITSKHHDGFCLWDTPSTDWKITNTPFRRDPLAELATALHDRGLGLHFYYSLLDWTRPSYRDDWPAYVAYYQGHLRELCSRFGRIDGIIFDGYWPRARFEGADEAAYFPPRGTWDLAGTYDLIHSLQPGAMVANNTHVLPLPGEDYQVWELDLPGENTIGFNTTDVGDRPTAAWWNLNTGWAYAPRTHRVKDAADIARVLRKANDRGASFFLNVGPRPWGDIHPEEALALRRIGQVLCAEDGRT
jgi:alpha-L-fucosidase